MHKPLNADPSKPWNQEPYVSDPDAPHNSPLFGSDPLKPWNDNTLDEFDLSYADQLYYGVVHNTNPGESDEDDDDWDPDYPREDGPWDDFDENLPDEDYGEPIW